MKCQICNKEISEKEWNEIKDYWYKGQCHKCTNEIIEIREKEKMNDKEFLERLPEIKKYLKRKYLH